jgi:uncharacterized protein
MRKTENKWKLLVAAFALSLVVVGCQTGPSSSNLQQIRAAAQQGDAEAQYELGNAYYYGKGVPQDYKEAQMWYDKAAASYRK